jgi:1-acyl-sn-glycerol-3-phosphate acyltransferase
MQDWLSEPWYEFAYWVTATIYTLGFSLRVEGGRHVPRKGPVLLLANHESYLDPVAVGLAARRHVDYLARRTLFENPILGKLLPSYNVIPVNQEGFAREGLQTILKQLQAGRAVLIFPEGNRTEDGRMQPLRPGILLLMKRVTMPIIPVGVAGGFEAWSRFRRYPTLAPLFLPASRGTMAVAIGRPLDSRQFADMDRQKVLSRLFVEIETMKVRAEKLRRKPTCCGERGA